MASEIAKKAAGTFVEDKVGNPLPVGAWILNQCRHGILAKHVKSFCDAQDELLDPALVLVESLTSECIHLRIPCRLFDHESAHPYNSEVRFTLNPATGKTQRV